MIIYGKPLQGVMFLDTPGSIASQVKNPQTSFVDTRLSEEIVESQNPRVPISILNQHPSPPILSKLTFSQGSTLISTENLVSLDF